MSIPAVPSEYYQKYFSGGLPVSNKDVLTHKIECSVCGYCELYNKTFTEEEAVEYHLKTSFHLNNVDRQDAVFNKALKKHYADQFYARAKLYTEYENIIKKQYFGVSSIYQEFKNGLRKLRKNIF